MQRIDFEKLVAAVLEDLPKQFQEKLDNVVVTVEDFPTYYQALKLKLRRGMILFGLYEGVPQTKRGAGYMLIPPDKITIFQKPIEYFYRTDEAIKTKVKETVLHEIGHHFGLTDREIRQAQD